MVLPGARADTGEESLRGAPTRPGKLALPAPPIRYHAGSLLARSSPLASFLFVALLVRADAADRIILRNLELIADRTVVSVDEDGARLDAPRALGSDRVTWDEIERGRVSPELQEEFDRLRTELGPPLYKLRQRLRIGDYAGLLEPAEKLYATYAERRSQTAYLVCQSLVWGRLAAGKREQAVEPLLRCVELLDSGAAEANRLPGSRRLRIDASSPLCGDLPPVWLNPVAVKEALPAVQKLIREPAQRRPSQAYLYYASLASEAGEFDEASKVLGALSRPDDGARQAQQLIRAQIEIQRKLPGGATSGLEQTAAGTHPLAAELASYWRGMHLLGSSDADLQRDGLLALLAIPAKDPAQQSELAAAALHQAARALDSLGDATGGQSVRRELRTRYAATAVGVQSLGPAK